MQLSHSQAQERQQCSLPLIWPATPRLWLLTASLRLPSLLSPGLSQDRPPQPPCSHKPPSQAAPPELPPPSNLLVYDPYTFHLIMTLLASLHSRFPCIPLSGVQCIPASSSTTAAPHLGHRLALCRTQLAFPPATVPLACTHSLPRQGFRPRPSPTRALHSILLPPGCPTFNFPHAHSMPVLLAPASSLIIPCSPLNRITLWPLMKSSFSPQSLTLFRLVFAFDSSDSSSISSVSHTAGIC